MVTPEEIKSKTFSAPMPEMQKGYKQVSSAEMASFNDDYDELKMDIGDVIDKYVKEHNIKPKYEGLEELTHLTATTIKHAISGRDRVTRTMLYKLTVGFKMPLAEANELFRKCGGTLKQDCLEDYICIRALEDEDSVVQFIEDYNHYTSGAQLKDPFK